MIQRKPFTAFSAARRENRMPPEVDRHLQNVATEILFWRGTSATLPGLTRYPDGLTLWIGSVPSLCSYDRNTSFSMAHFWGRGAIIQPTGRAWDMAYKIGK